MSSRSICWKRISDDARDEIGTEHLLLEDRAADSLVIAIDEDRSPFRLTYRLAWDESWRLSAADLVVNSERQQRSLALRSDGRGHWRTGDGHIVGELDGCNDIDIWPTPFTNTFPIRRVPMVVGERCEFRIAWIFAPDLTFHSQSQAYTRIAERTYLFESLDGSGFRAELTVDANGIVTEYPGFFRRC